MLRFLIPLGHTKARWKRNRQARFCASTRCVTGLNRAANKLSSSAGPSIRLGAPSPSSVTGSWCCVLSPPAGGPQPKTKQLSLTRPQLNKTSGKRKKALRPGRRRCCRCGPTWNPTHSFRASGVPAQTRPRPLDSHDCLSASDKDTESTFVPDSTNYWWRGRLEYVSCKRVAGADDRQFTEKRAVKGQGALST